MLQSETVKIRERFESEQQLWEDVYHRSDYDARGFQWRQQCAVSLCRKHLPVGASVVDLGCGCGHATATLARLGYKALGVDISEAMIAQARTNAETLNLGEQCRFLVANVAKSRETLGTFDGLVALGFIEYFDDPGGILRVMHELLNPMGIAIVQIWNRRPLADTCLSPLHFSYRKLTHPIYSLKQLVKLALPGKVVEALGSDRSASKNCDDLTQHHRYTRGELHRMAKKAGFRPVDARGSRFFPKRFFFGDERKAKWDERLQQHAAQSAVLRGLAVDYVAVLRKL